MKNRESRFPPPPSSIADDPRARHSVPPAAATAKTTHARSAQAPVSPWERAAQSLSSRDVVQCAVDVQLASQNLVAGAGGLLSSRAEVDAAMPGVDWARVESTADLAMRLTLQPSTQPDATGARALRSALTPLSRAIFSDAALQVERGRLDAAVVKPLLRRATGTIGRVRVLIQLVRMYTDPASKVGGRTALDDDDLKKAEALATQLLPLLRQSSSRAAPRDGWRDARDRYWTLAVQQHAWMQRIAGAVWGVELTAHVPPLQSRRVVRRTKAPSPAPPAPPAPPVTP